MIRPFQLGDIFLIQRLGSQATKLNIVQSLLQPQSASWASLTAVVPWNDARVATYVLNQQGHGLVGNGFLQVQKRPGRPEAEIVRVAPGLDTPRGHPAIWEKLLAHYNAEATHQQIARIYVDVPDQPLPVHTFNHVGFRAYTRQTIWRLSAFDASIPTGQTSGEIRPQGVLDEWPLQQLYARVVPETVQLAEGMHTGQGDHQGGHQGNYVVKPPILEWWQPGMVDRFVMERRGEIVGAVQIVQGPRGYWLRPWADLYDPNPYVIHTLLRHALHVIWRRAITQPIYVGVCDYHGGLGAILSDYGFAPFTDRAKMVKPVVQWVREAALDALPALERARQVAPAHFTIPASRAVRLRQRGIAYAGAWRSGILRHGVVRVSTPAGGRVTSPSLGQ